MESVLSRYRNLIVLVGVLFLQLLGLAVQVKRSADAENTRLIRIWAVDSITPFERGLVWLQNGTGNLWHNYFYLRGVRAENRQLKEQIQQMRLEQVRLIEDAAQAHRLQALLAFKEQFVSKTVAAQVIGSSGSDSSRMLYVDKGENDGIARDMAVVTADGIVGKVLQVFPSVSQVLLISDQSSGVGALLEKSRLQGVLRGTANGEVVLERVMTDEEVHPGEVVLTSGGDQIFPKGLPIGTVTYVGSGKDLFLKVRVRPAANLSKLEEVLIVTEKQERQAMAQDTVRMRAADILAQRLPSVPEKPAEAAGATPAVTGTQGNKPPVASGTAKLTSKPGVTPASPSGNAARVQNPQSGKPAAVSSSASAAAGSPVTKNPAVAKPGKGIVVVPEAQGDSGVSKPAASPAVVPDSITGPSIVGAGTEVPSPAETKVAEPQSKPPKPNQASPQPDSPPPNQNEPQ
jgi:rod shape-determining protein MreC